MKLFLLPLLVLNLFAMEIIIDTSLSKDKENFIKYVILQHERSYFEPEMVRIKAGNFLMGSRKGDADERPVHKVRIKRDFYIGKYEVTFKEYDQFCEKTDRYMPDDEGWGRDNMPVINITWHDAKAYTEWLSEVTGDKYRLPTEAEWEYAAKAGVKTDFAFGKKAHTRNANYNGKDKDPRYGRTGENRAEPLPVGSFKANRWGLHDVHGNVWEWCEDWHTRSYKNAPKNGSANITSRGEHKILRGGSWSTNASSIRLANRGADNPLGSGSIVGFRILKER